MDGSIFSRVDSIITSPNCLAFSGLLCNKLLQRPIIGPPSFKIALRVAIMASTSFTYSLSWGMSAPYISAN